LKVRVLYPTGFIGHMDEEPEAGKVVTIDDAVGEALIGDGYAEAHDAKPPEVEQATAAPGEKRTRAKKAAS
jgi:hypothetical protein